MAVGSPSVGRTLPVSPREPFLVARRTGRSSELFGAVPRDDRELRDLARACRPDPVRRQRVMQLLLAAWRDQSLPDASRAAAARLAADPTTAIRYQIIVMLMLVAATAIGSTIVVHVVRRLCFTRASQPILR